MAAAKPEVSKGKTFTAIWIIPLVALLLGAWMVVHAFMTEGPEIEIEFKTASGLEADKTKVKFRNVEMGKVQEVRLSDDMESVIAVVKLKREAIPLLGEDTRFWIVTARIGGGGISGLDTVLSGAYIELAPGKSKGEARKFVGLDEPPLTPTGAPGLRLILLSDQAGSVSSGDPVLYKGYKVGRVESLTFGADSEQIRYSIFIDAPYHNLVDSSVRFWDVSGITVTAGADGLQVSTGSVESLLVGGITFGKPPDALPGVPVEHESKFQLHSSYQAMLDTPFDYRAYYVVAFEQSLKGLLPGAPVEYRGIHVGNVDHILIKEFLGAGIRENKKGDQGLPIPVLINFEPARAAMPDTEESLQQVRRAIEEGVGNGLRATLVTGNLLSGAKFVDLEYFPDAPAAEMGEFEGYASIPTVSTGLGELEDKISRLLDKANDLPLHKTVSTVNLALTELNQSLKSLRVILGNDNLRTIPGELQSTLEALRSILEDDNIQAVPAELRSTLAAAKYQLQGQSTEAYQLGRTLKEVESAARALREFLDFLEKSPEALIRGKTKPGE
jgi:paraquat-inducible protein B